MSKTCIIHIGMPKAGSTAIQNFLSGHREQFLQSYDINFYAETDRQSDLVAALTLMSAGFQANRGLYFKEDIKRVQADTLSDFERELRQNNSSVFVISVEGLSLVDLQSVEYVKAIVSKYFDRVQIVCYVRNPYSFAQSACQQLFKGGATLQKIIENSYNREPLDLTTMGTAVIWPNVLPLYHWRIEKFITVFGQENVIIRDFTRSALINQDVIDDFLRCILNLKVDRDHFRQINIHENTSMDHTVAWTLEQINRLYPRDFLVDDVIYANPNRAKSVITHINKAEESEDRFRLVNFDWDRFHRVIEPDINWLKEITDGHIDFTTIPVPETEAEASFEKSEILAQVINSIALKADDARLQLSINGILYRASRAMSKDALDLKQIERILTIATLPSPLLKLAKGLKNQGFNEAALWVARKGLFLCALDPEKTESFEKLVNTLSRP